MSARPHADGHGSVVRVGGPLVEIEGLPHATVAEVVEVGDHHALGEIVRLEGDVATVQMYEYTGGIGPGTAASGTGGPLAVPLGPGLLGGIFDGLLRPLPGAPDLLGPGWGRSSLGAPERRFRFTPAVVVGDQLTAGATIGTVEETPAVTHHIIVPSGIAGEVTEVAEAGLYTVDATVVRIDAEPLTLTQWWPVRRPRPVRARLRADVPLRTGQRIVDVLFPIARGSTAAVPGGFGTGKTMLLQQIAKWCDAQVIVYVGCGERGNEMADLLEDFSELEDPRTGRALMERTAIIVNTSNMPVMAREASIYTGITVAEYYRDMGYDTVVIADSTSRWAQALREFATRTGELPAEEGYPARLASALADFYERAGQVRTLSGREATATIIGAVSPSGGDKSEPVTSHTQRFVRCFWSLDPDLASARHYPAVSWDGSFSRDADGIASWYVEHGDPDWPRRRAHLMSVLAESDELQSTVQLVGEQALPDRERITLITARLIREGLLQQNALDEHDAYSGPDKERALVEAVLAIHERALDLHERGVPASIIEEVDLSPILRVREQAAPDQAQPIEDARDRVLARLEEQA
ncbi:MAG: V-type ATP synthase subunit A [Nitriliruptoraceae bacterium]